MIVDFHAYIQPAGFLDRLRNRTGYPRVETTAEGDVFWSGPGAARRIRPEQNDISRRIAMLDEARVDAQVLRLQNVSGIDALDPIEGVDVAQAANEEIAQLARQYRGRFIAFASLPLRKIDAAVSELDRAVSSLGHRGVGVSGFIDGAALDDPRFDPLFERAAALDVPVLILPNHPSTLRNVVHPHNWLIGAVGFQVDITVVALRLLCGGIFERYPKLKLILANLGGVYPFILGRIDEYWKRLHAAPNALTEPPVEALRKFYIETASADPGAIRLAAETLGADRILFGSDYPSFDVSRAVQSVRGSGISEKEIDAILRNNARALLA